MARKVAIIKLDDALLESQKTTFMLVDDETLITVKGLGTEAYSWKACNNENYRTLDQYDPSTKAFQIFGRPQNANEMNDGWNTFGPGGMRVRPLTLAHMIMDCVG